MAFRRNQKIYVVVLPNFSLILHKKMMIEGQSFPATTLLPILISFCLTKIPNET